MVSLELKQPKAALYELEQSVHADQWRGRLVRALALVQLGRMTEARREVESSLNSCVGPAQCDLATTVQQALFPDTEKGRP